MLRYYVRRSLHEAFVEVRTRPASDVWIHGDAVTEADLGLLATSYNLDINVLRDVLDKDELPRVEKKDGGLYVFVTAAQRGKHGRVMTTPVLLAVKDSVFINISMATMADHRLATPSVLTGSDDTTSLLLGTFAAVVSEYEGLMQHVARNITDTRHRLRTHEITNRDFIRFVTVEDNLNTYHMNLSSMQVVAQRLQETLEGNDKEAVEDILLYVRQLLVSIDSHVQSITSIRNAYSTVANNVLNQRMKTLTALTVLIALPNVFYGMYGMNVALPYQHAPWAYAVMMAVTIAVVLIVYLLAKRFKVF